MHTVLHYIRNRNLKMSKQKPVLDKVQGSMAGVLKEENWPNPREREVMKRKKIFVEEVIRSVFIVENVKRNFHAR